MDSESLYSWSYLCSSCGMRLHCCGQGAASCGDRLLVLLLAKWAHLLRQSTEWLCHNSCNVWSNAARMSRSFSAVYMKYNCPLCMSQWWVGAVQHCCHHNQWSNRVQPRTLLNTVGKYSKIIVAFRELGKFKHRSQECLEMRQPPQGFVSS